MAIILTFLVNAGLNFVLGLLVAKFLGPDEFGRYAVAQAISVFINTAVFDWIRLAAARHYTEAVRDREPGIRATLDILSLATTLTVLSLLAVCAVAGVDFRLPTPLIAAATVATIGSALFDYHATLIRARFLDRVYAFAVALRHSAAFALMLGGAIWFESATAVFIGMALSTLGSVGALRRVLADPAATFAAASRPRAMSFARYGVPLVIANALYTAMLLLNRTLIAGAYGYAEAGHFSLAYDVGVRVIAALGTGLDIVLFAHAVKAEATEGARKAAEQVARNIVVILAFIAPCAAGYWLVLPGFEALFVPQAYRGPFRTYSDILVPLIFLFGLINYVLNPVFQIARRTAPVVIAALIGFGANLAGVALLPAHIGARGYALAALFGYAVSAAVACLLAFRAMEVRPSAADLAKVAAATAAMFVVLAPFRLIEPPVAAMAVIAAAGLAIYGALAWFLDIGGVRGFVRDRRAARNVATAPAADGAPH